MGGIMENPWKRKSKVNPQREDGHREIETKLWRALMKQRLSGVEWDVIAAVIDKTYGFNKTHDCISYGQLAEMTKRDRRYIMKGVARLIVRRILVVSKTTLANQIMLNKHYDTWSSEVVSKTTLVSKRTLEVVSKKTPKVVSKRTPTIKRKNINILDDLVSKRTLVAMQKK